MKTKRLPLALCLLAATACGRVANVGQVPDMTAPHATPEFQAMAAPFQEYADNPTFILIEDL